MLRLLKISQIYKPSQTQMMSIEGPNNWQDEIYVDCGEDGMVSVQLEISSPPATMHQENLQRIVDRWSDIWPQFREIITSLMETYHQGPPDWTAIRTLYLEVPDAAMADDVEWSVSVEFSASVTLWTLPYLGWADMRKLAQAIW